MRLIKFVVIICFVLFINLSVFSQDHPVKAGPTATQELYDQINHYDRLLFDAAFNNCNADKVGELIAEDFEFYHDKDGLVATSKSQFVESLRKMCAGRKTGQNIKARRELVKGSMKVYPLNNYGAIQIGVHRFYGIQEGKKDILREVAQFTHLWKKTDGKWLLARVMSYDHRPVKTNSKK